MKNLLQFSTCCLFLFGTITFVATGKEIPAKTPLKVKRDDCSKSVQKAEDAYKYAQSAEDADNFEAVRKYAREAVDAFDDAKALAEKCGCENAGREAGNGYKLAKKASKSENLQDAKEYARDARKSADDVKSYARKCSGN